MLFQNCRCRLLLVAGIQWIVDLEALAALAEAGTKARADHNQLTLEAIGLKPFFSSSGQIVGIGCHLLICVGWMPTRF